MKRITPLDYAVMGLLQEGAKTGYAIRQVFEQTALGNYSSSPGSIYPVLNKLVKMGWIEKRANEEKSKKQFNLLPSGKSALLEWLKRELVPEDISKNMEEVLLKFAFMETLLDKKERLGFLKQLQAQLKTSLQQLKDFHDSHAEVLSLHGRLALENGIEGQKAHLRWTRHAIKAINKQMK